MSLAIQAKVLRVLEYQQFEPVGGTKSIQVNIRIITASNKNINHLISKGAFRKDLFFRLGVLILTIPPLRERGEDINTLTYHFAHFYKKKYKRSITNISVNALQELNTYDWPGNIRELKSVIERAVLFCDGDTITKNHILLSAEHLIPQDNSTTDAKEQNLASLEQDNESQLAINQLVTTLSNNGYKKQMSQAISTIEKTWIEKTLQKCDFIQKDVAKELGISPRVLCYKLQRHQIHNPFTHSNRRSKNYNTHKKTETNKPVRKKPEIKTGIKL
jgi:DNA-binding NtrC family response regulator